MRKAFGLSFVALILSTQALAQNVCEEHLVAGQIQAKTLSTLTLPGRSSAQIEFVQSDDGNQIVMVQKDSGKVSVIDFSKEKAAVVSNRFLGGIEGTLKSSQVLDSKTKHILVAGQNSASKKLQIEDLNNVVGGFKVDVKEDIRLWKMVETLGQPYLVVTTATSLIVLRQEGAEYVVKAELKNVALFTSLEVIPDGNSLFIVAKGDLRAHIMKYERGNITLVRQIVQLGGDIRATLTDTDLVIASMDRSDRTVNFYSLKDNRRSDNFPVDGEIGRSNWLKLANGKTVFVLNSGSRAKSDLLIFSADKFEKVETLSPKVAAVVGGVEHISALEFNGRDYYVFSQEGRHVRLVNHVDEKIVTAAPGMMIRQVTAPHRLQDGRIVIGVLSSDSKTTKIEVVQVGQ